MRRGSFLLGWSLCAALLGSNLEGDDLVIPFDTLSFEPPANHPLGRNAEAIAIGDLTGDGLPDLAVGNSGARGEGGNNVSVLITLAAGGFSLLGPFPTGVRPEGIIMADFNGDLTLDVATADFGGSTISVLLGDGSGALADPIQTQVDGSPRSLVASDLNGDGSIDLAVAAYSGSTVQVLLGAGTGSFLVVQTIPTGEGPEVIALGHLNADEHLDLVTANALAGTVTPLINDGTGRFTASPDHTVGARPRFVAAADLDGDGLADLAVANTDSDSIGIERNLGGGSFANIASVSYNTPSLTFRSPTYLALADVDGDGRLDLLATWARSEVFTISRSTPDAYQFREPFAYQTGDTPVGIAAADFEGDGDMDVAVTNALDDNCFIYASYLANPGLLLDNGGTGTREIGSWSTSAAPFPLGADSVFSKDGTRYTFDAGLEAPGIHEVFIRWTVTINRSPSVPVEVLHADGVSNLRVDQTRGMGLWHSLGKYAFNDRGRVTITCPNGPDSASPDSDSADSVSADAVRFLPIPGESLPPTRGTITATARVRPDQIQATGGGVLAFQGSLEALSPTGNEGQVFDWISATLAPVGAGIEETGIAACRLHIDSNGNKVFDGEDRQLGAPAAFGSDIRVITIEGFTEALGHAAPVEFFVICEVNPGVPFDDLQLELASIGVRAGSTGATSVIQGVPVRGWTFPEPLPLQRPSDANQDGSLDIADAVRLLEIFFRGTVPVLPCGDGILSDAGNTALLDANGDASADISDVIRLLGYLFRGLPPPALGLTCVTIAGCPDVCR